MMTQISRQQVVIFLLGAYFCFLMGTFTDTGLRKIFHAKQLESLVHDETHAPSGHYNLIITVAFEMPLISIRPYLESFEKNAHFTSRLLIIRGPQPLSEDDKTYLQRLERVEVLETQLPSGFSIHQGRYIIIHKYLTNLTKSETNCIKYVALSDSRDVIFQSDPFIESAAILQEKGGVIFSLEGGYKSNKTISECKYNTYWITKCFGQAILDDISSRPISCSGVTFGTLPGIMNYLTTLVHISVVGGPNCSSEGGIDQGIHNYMVHYLGDIRGLLGFPFHIVANRDSPVATIGYTKSDDLEWDRAKKMLRWRQDGHIPSVVHQFDRHPDISQSFLQTYS